MKKFWLLAATLLAFAGMGTAKAEAATATTQLFLNGKPLAAEVAPRIVNGNTIVPIRIIAENLGAKVGWDGGARQVTVTRDSLKLVMTIDKPEVLVNGAPTKIEEPPTIVDGNTLLPLRFVGEQLGVKFTWDELTRSVFMYKKAEAASTSGDVTETQTETDEQGGPASGSGCAVGSLGAAAGNGGAAAGGSTVSSGNSATTGRTSATTGNNTNVTGSSNLSNSSSASSTNSSTATSNSSSLTNGGGTETDSDCTTPAAGSTSGDDGATAGSADGKPTGSTASTGTAAGTSTSGGTNVAHAAEPDGNAAVGVVQGIELAGDRLIVKESGVTAKPNLFTLGNPDRLVLDLPYAVLDDAMKKKLVGTAGEIPVQNPLAQKIRFSNYSSEPATVRIIIDLKQHARLMPVDAKSLPAGQLAFDLSASKFRVVIDAGHGGKDSGAISVTNKMEKTFTLSMATKVAELLKKEPQIEPLMTRSDDTFVELDDRVAFANNRDADLFLSIHGNKYTASATGTETYYYRDESSDFAKVIHQHVVEAAGLPDRGVRTDAFRVIKYTTMPAVLVEVGYLSNKNDEKRMFDDAFQNQVAASLVAAIKEYLNIQ